MIHEVYFYFQENAYVAQCGGIYFLSKKTNLLLERWSSPTEESAMEPAESWAREAIWKSFPSPLKKKQTDLLQGPKGFTSRQSQLPQKLCSLDINRY